MNEDKYNVIGSSDKLLSSWALLGC